MKRVFRYSFLLFAVLNLSGTALAVPMGGSFFGSRSENYSGMSENESLNMSVLGAPWNLSGGQYWWDCSLPEITSFGAGRETLNPPLNEGVRAYADTLNTPSNRDTVFSSAKEGYPSGVPEPDTMMLLGSGLLVLAGIGRRFTRT